MLVHVSAFCSNEDLIEGDQTPHLFAYIYNL